jgi:muramoyltetrapeptide carboxypeptidase
MLLKPSRLRRGDVIGIAAPASAPPDPKAIDRSVQALEQLGFKTRLAPNVRNRWGFLAGSDRDRAADLMRLFGDPKVQAIVCMRGGYGSARLLPLLDYRLIRKHPKIFVGYSDITSLHSAFFVKAGLVSFHGPMLNSDFIHKPMPDYTLQTFLRMLTKPEAPGSICRGYRKKTVKVLHRGSATGELVGGNISILCASLGTPWQPPFKRRILFFEDLDEVPFRFDRMLTQLLNAGVLQQVAGIAIGINKNCKDPKARKTKEYRQTVEDVFKERLTPLGIPVVSGLPFGHIRWNATLPIGVKVLLDGTRGDLVITEPAVR